MSAIRPVFLLSLPRSGSTLLQRMLGAHPAISTHAEPWVLLPLLSALDERGVYARYDHRIARGAMQHFFTHFADGEHTYWAQVRRFALGLYEAASDAEAELFLDKTPRYGLYVTQLLRAFPHAPVIVLWRNPLAILASLSRSFDEGRWAPHRHVVDLYDSLENLTSAVGEDPARFYQIRYEDLVENPGGTVRPLVKYLDLRWEDSVEQDFAATDVEGPVGDVARPGSQSGRTTVSLPAPLQWQDVVASPVRKRYAMRYLNWIGSERLRQMGYDGEILRQQLRDTPTNWSTVPDDLMVAARGVASRLLEPQVYRDKWSRRHALYSIARHS